MLAGSCRHEKVESKRWAGASPEHKKRNHTLSQRDREVFFRLGPGGREMALSPGPDEMYLFLSPGTSRKATIALTIYPRTRSLLLSLAACKTPSFLALGLREKAWFPNLQGNRRDISRLISIVNQESSQNEIRPVLPVSAGLTAAQAVLDLTDNLAGIAGFVAGQR